MKTLIDVMFEGSQELKGYLQSQDQISFLNDVDDQSRKALLLSAASYFEQKITELLNEHIRYVTTQNTLVISFVKNKAISRQYHTFFKWDDTNANQFWGLFGTDFKNEMKELLRRNTELDESVKAFLELGNERNKLVHGNFASFSLEKTSEEIYALYKKAVSFIDFLEKRFPSGI